MSAPVRGSTTAFGISTISGFAGDMYAALPHQKSYPTVCPTGSQEILAALSAGEIGTGDDPRITSACHCSSKVCIRWARILRMPR